MNIYWTIKKIVTGKICTLKMSSKKNLENSRLFYPKKNVIENFSQKKISLKQIFSEDNFHWKNNSSKTVQKILGRNAY